MLMAQRYPAYFDGIVAGAPAMRTSFSGHRRRVGRDDAKPVAPKDAAGQADTRAGVVGRRQKAVIDGMLERLRRQRRRQGRHDLQHPQAASSIRRRSACKGAKTDGCLSTAQAAAIEKAFAGPKDSKGRQVYPGFSFDTGIAKTQGIAGIAARRA